MKDVFGPNVIRSVIAWSFCFTLTATTSAQSTNSPQLIDLPTALRLAGAQNVDVQIARQRLLEAQAGHQSTVWQFFPWLSPGVGYRRHDDLIQDVAGDINEVHKQSYAAGPTIAAQLDLGDSIYKNLAAKQLVKAADYAIDSQRLAAVVEAAQSYFELAKFAGLADVIRESLRISADYQSQLHEAVAAGIAFRGDELRAQVQTERYQLSLRQSREQERLAASRLAQILRLDPAVALVPKDTELAPMTLIETNTALDSLVSQALRARPELLENKALTAAAQDAKNGAVYGPLIPTVGAQAFLGGLGGGRDSGSSTFGWSEDYAVGVSWRVGPGGLFDSGRTRSKQAQLEISRLAGVKVADEITRQVVDGFTRAISLVEQLPTVRTNLATASETLRLSRERKQFGVAAVLEDIQAQQELTRARSDYLTVVADYNKAQYQLQRAVGRPVPEDQRTAVRDQRPEAK